MNRVMRYRDRHPKPNPRIKDFELPPLRAGESPVTLMKVNVRRWLGDARPKHIRHWQPRKLS